MNRPKKPLPKGSGRPIADSLARGLRESNPLPARKLGDDLVERARMCPESEAGCELGPYVPHDRPADLDGPTQVLKFPTFLARWFARQTPETVAAIDRLTRREMRRALVREILAENWKRMGVAGCVAYGVFQWGVEALVWFSGKLPALQGLWQALKHGPPT